MSRRFQFSLRTLLATFIVAALVAWEVSMAMRPPAPPNPGQVIGHVEMEGTPLPGAEVKFSGYRGRIGPLHETALADNAGNFTISLPPGVYEYSISPFEYFGRVEGMPRLCLFAEQEGRVVVSSDTSSKLSITLHNQVR